MSLPRPFLQATSMLLTRMFAGQAKYFHSFALLLVSLQALFEKMKKTYPDYAHPPRGQAMGYATELDSEVEVPSLTVEAISLLVDAPNYNFWNSGMHEACASICIKCSIDGQSTE